MEKNTSNLLILSVLIIALCCGCPTQNTERTARSMGTSVPNPSTPSQPPNAHVTPLAQRANPTTEPQIKLSGELQRLDVMVMLGQSGSQLQMWNLSYAKGTYSQTFQDKRAVGEIVDLGGLKIENGKEYPFLMAEGTVFVRRSENQKPMIEETTNERGFTVRHEEQIWNSANGAITISRMDGVFGFVLDPEGFPRVLRVIGVSDAKHIYLYASE